MSKAAAKNLFVGLASLAFFAAISFEALGQDWDLAVERVKSLAQKLSARADAVGWECCLGTAYNEYMVREHQCAILGRMVGKARKVKHLEPALPSLKSRNGFDLALAAHSLDNWQLALASAKKMPMAMRIETWNLNCAGNLKISADERIDGGIANTFYNEIPDQKTIRILGRIEAGFFTKLKKALEDNPDVESVALGSGGGYVQEAIAAGRLIRSRGLTTLLYDNCFSACPLVFLGGVERQIWSPYFELGFHQLYNSKGPLPPDNKQYVRVREYAKEMGVDEKFVINSMLGSSPKEMFVPKSWKLCDVRVATWVQRQC